MNKVITQILTVFSAILVVSAAGVVSAADGRLHHIHITTSSPLEGVNWYSQHLGCERIEDRNDAARCGSVEIHFVAQPSLGRSQDTGVDHIAFSFADLPAKM